MDTILTEDQYLKIIKDIITPEEINQFFILRDKMVRAEEAIEKEELKIAEVLHTEKTHDGPVPYLVTLTLNSDIVIPPASHKEPPEPVEHKSQSYVIEFIDKNYSTLISLIYEKFTEVLSSACKDLSEHIKEPENVDTNTEK
jgi:hypothetical protein